MNFDQHTFTKYPAALVLEKVLENFPKKNKAAVLRFLQRTFLFINSYQELSPEVRRVTLLIYKKHVIKAIKEESSIPVEAHTFMLSIINAHYKAELRICQEESSIRKHLKKDTDRLYIKQVLESKESFKVNIGKHVKKISGNVFRGSGRTIAIIVDVIDHPITKRPAYLLENIKLPVECFKCILV